MKYVLTSATEANKLGALLINSKDVNMLILMLREIGHTHTPTMIHCDNNTTVGIITDTVNEHRSWLTEMPFFGNRSWQLGGSSMCSGTKVRGTLEIIFELFCRITPCCKCNLGRY